MKRFLALLLCLALCLTLIPAAFAEDIEIVDTEIDLAGEAEDEIVIDEPEDELIVIDEPGEESAEEEILAAEPASGDCGDALTWTLDEAGKLTISGTGAMWEYTGSRHPGWYDQADAIRSVAVEEGVTRIGAYAFSDLRKMSSITLPDGLLSIGARAFRSCKALTGVTIPDTVVRIEAYAFLWCEGLKSATLPQGLIALKDSTFSGCLALAQIELPESLTSIGPAAFYNCGLTELTVPASVTSIASEAFAGCTALKGIKFLGCPEIAADSFSDVSATVFYPDDGGWTEEMRQDYGPGTLTWVPFSATLKLNRTSLSVAVKGAAELKASFSTGADASGFVTWSSSNNSVATVDANGVVTAKKYGKCSITARFDDLGISASCQVQTLFWDVADPSKYYFKPVYWAAEHGITAGYNYEYFDPQGECTREQMMTFMWRMAGKPEPETKESPFKDVSKGDYFFKAVMWGVENGITNGYTAGPYAGRFGVGMPCLREQAMTFLWRMKGKPEPRTTTNPFKDVMEFGYYYKAVLWASENGIAKGYEDGTYGVGKTCLREHMVTFLSRYYNKFM